MQRYPGAPLGSLSPPFACAYESAQSLAKISQKILERDNNQRKLQPFFCGLSRERLPTAMEALHLKLAEPIRRMIWRKPRDMALLGPQLGHYRTLHPRLTVRLYVR
jgi:hypothetical protein